MTTREVFTPSATMCISCADLVDRAALAELLADVAVAALLAHAGGDQIAHAGEAGEGLQLAAHGDAEAGQLGEAAGDHRRLGVVADAEAVAHAGGDGDDVLQRPADLAADHVLVGVDAEDAST